MGLSWLKIRANGRFSKMVMNLRVPQKVDNFLSSCTVPIIEDGLSCTELTG